jgi:hypothetical protein
MRALVKECLSTSGAVASKPQAAITSVTPPFPGLEPQIGTGAEWQQSYNNRTSESDSSSRHWMPPEENSMEGSSRFL